MKTKSAPVKIIRLFAVLIYLSAVISVFSQTDQPFSINTSPLDAPTGFVNDYAGVIDADTKQQLEQKLTNLKNKTNPSVEIAVAVVKTTGERPIFDYSLAVARGWKIGSKEDDNPSALLFIAIDDRKYFTQVSKDLEDELPDGAVGSLQRQFLVPAFKQGNYSKGVADTIDAYIKTIEAKQNGTEPPPISSGQNQQKTKAKESSLSIGGIVCCLGVGLLVLMALGGFGKSKRGRDDNDRWGGGGFGGGALPWIIGSIIANSGNSSGSSGSSWGGTSDSGSGGSDWGGFGGGGDFGGGGAGGDW